MQTFYSVCVCVTLKCIAQLTDVKLKHVCRIGGYINLNVKDCKLRSFSIFLPDKHKISIDHWLHIFFPDCAAKLQNASRRDLFRQAFKRLIHFSID